MVNILRYLARKIEENPELCDIIKINISYQGHEKDINVFKMYSENRMDELYGMDLESLKYIMKKYNIRSTRGMDKNDMINAIKSSIEKKYKKGSSFMR
ncbi:hypothetical protein [Picrophilus oshimae]|nr:hypothetical protein [Picrophilus oshimae]